MLIPKLCSYPNSCLGTHLYKKLCFDSYMQLVLFQIVNFQFSFYTKSIWSGRTVSPMLRLPDKSSFYRIEMYVFNFLSEYFLAVDYLRMKTFLPKLIFTIGFMLQFVILKLIKKPVFIISFKQINYRPGSITLYWCNGLTKIISTENWMEMIFENYIRIYFKILFSLWIFKRAGKNIKILFACKNRNPFWTVEVTK